jgi:hypothetical protein
LDLLEAAEAAALVREPVTVVGRFSFTHALIQRTLYQDLSANRRARTHERVAEALEDLCAGRPGDRVGELAHHWAQAMRPADTAKAVEYAAQAGDAAMAGLAPAEAVRWFTQALDLLGADGDPHRRAELLIGLGLAQEQDGLPAYRDTLLEAAELADRTGDVDVLVRAALANTRGYVSSVGDVDQERLDVIERALERLGERDPASRARLLALSVAERIYVLPFDDRLRLAREAVDLALASGDPVAVLRTAMFASTAASVPWTLSERLEWTRAAVRAADELDDVRARFLARGSHRQGLLEACDRAGADAVTTWEDSHIDWQPPVHRWNYKFERSYLAVLDGDLDEARSLAGEALHLALATGQPDAVTFYGIQYASLMEACGRLGELAREVEKVLRRTPGLTGTRATLALACAEASEIEQARELLAADRDAGFSLGEDFGWLYGHMHWAKAASVVGDVDTAEVLWKRMAPFRDHLVFTGATVSPVTGHYVARLEHLLGRLGDADASFARAHELHRQLRAPQFIARTEVRWAQMLTDRNQGDDHDRARALAESARNASAGRSGWDWIERDARRTIDALG